MYALEFLSINYLANDFVGLNETKSNKTNVFFDNVNIVWMFNDCRDLTIV